MNVLDAPLNYYWEGWYTSHGGNNSRYSSLYSPSLKGMVCRMKKRIAKKAFKGHFMILFPLRFGLIFRIFGQIKCYSVLPAF